jgi:acid stress-induced BolA-like protein IbaG/YrbA
MAFASDMSAEIKHRIEQALPGAKVEVFSGSDRHYEISVISETFADMTPVKQQQSIYATISDLMAGDNAPVHAIDRMDLRSE